MTPNFEPEAEAIVNCLEKCRAITKYDWPFVKIIIADALRAAARDAIIEFCEGEDSKMAEIERAAYQKGMQEVNSQDYWEARVKEAHEESRYEALEQAAKVAEKYTTESIEVCGQADHDIRWCSDCDRMTTMADVIEQAIRCLRPEGGEAK